jgi:hypothetical protein
LGNCERVIRSQLMSLARLIDRSLQDVIPNKVRDLDR